MVLTSRKREARESASMTPGFLRDDLVDKSVQPSRKQHD